MLSCETRHTVHQDHAKGMDGTALLRLFLTAGIFAVGALRQIYAHHRHFVTESCKPGLRPFQTRKQDQSGTPQPPHGGVCLLRDALQKAVLCF